MATVVYVSPAAMFAQMLVLGVALGLALIVLIAHLARPAVKRMVAAAALAFSFAAVARVTLHADDGDFVIVNPCKDLTPADPMWWVMGCMWP